MSLGSAATLNFSNLSLFRTTSLTLFPSSSAKQLLHLLDHPYFQYTALEIHQTRNHLHLSILPPKVLIYPIYFSSSRVLYFLIFPSSTLFLRSMFRYPFASPSSYLNL